MRRGIWNTKKKYKNTPEEREKMWNFFLEIWKERPHYCQITGKWLGNQPKSWHFDHLLEKSKYPELAFEKDNIILVDFEVHELKTNGFPLPKHRELIEQAKQKFLNK